MMRQVGCDRRTPVSVDVAHDKAELHFGSGSECCRLAWQRQALVYDSGCRRGNQIEQGKSQIELKTLKRLTDRNMIAT